MKQKWYLAAIFILSLFSIRCGHLGLPWWCSGQTVKQRSLCATTSKPGSCNYRSLHGLGPRSDDWWISVPQQPKPVHPEPVVYSKRSHPSERPRHHNAEEPLLSTTRATKTQHSQKQINVYFLKCGHLTFFQTVSTLYMRFLLMVILIYFNTFKKSSCLGKFFQVKI